MRNFCDRDNEKDIVSLTEQRKVSNFQVWVNFQEN